MKLSLAIIVVLAPVLFLLPACGKTNENAPNKDVAQLRQQFQNLSEDNKRLKDELASLRQELELQRELTPPAQTTQASEPGPGEIAMNVEKMKADLQGLLPGALEKAKLRLETPRTDQQYGMRVEFDLKRAIYGLIENRDETVPYAAKVIVPYEKFLESGRSSKSYGLGTTTILFAYVDKTWELRSVK